MSISKRLRYEVFRRDRWRCRYCGRAGTPANPLVPDHVIPRTLGGTDTPDNLVASCTDCNAGKGSTLPDGPFVAEVRVDEAVWIGRWTASGQFLAGQVELSRTLLEHLGEEEREYLVAEASSDGVDEADAVVNAVETAMLQLTIDRYALDGAAGLLLRAVPEDIRAEAAAACDAMFGGIGYASTQSPAEVLADWVRAVAATYDLRTFAALPVPDQEAWLDGAEHELPDVARDALILRIRAAENARRFDLATYQPREPVDF